MGLGAPGWRGGALRGCRAGVHFSGSGRGGGRWGLFPSSLGQAFLSAQHCEISVVGCTGSFCRLELAVFLNSSLAFFSKATVRESGAYRISLQLC